MKTRLTGLSAAIIAALLLSSAPLAAQTTAAPAAPLPAVAPMHYLNSIPWDAEYDVIVLGYGFAGGSAAIAAADNGAKVLLSEKAPKGSEGGNSRYAAQHVIFVRPDHSDEDALAYMKALRGPNTNPSDATLEAFVKGARQNIDYLKFLGAKDPKVEIRAEYPDAPGADAIGSCMVHKPGGDGALYALVQENVQKRGDKINVWYNAPGKKLLQDPQTGIIHGVLIEVDGVPKYVRAKNGVILATGGYENNPDMYRNFAAQDKAFSKGARFNTGDGIIMADDVQANIVNTGNNNGPDPNVVDPQTGISCGYMVAGAKDSAWSGPAFTRHNVIMVGKDGKRFWNEAQKTRHGRVPFHGDYVHLLMPDPAYMVFDENARLASKIYGSWSEGSEKEIASGLIKKADTLEELAKIIGVDAQGLAEQVKAYNTYCEEGADPEFNRPKALLKPLNKAPYYAVQVQPTFTNTLGGPERNENAQIKSRHGGVIPHLYGAGELGSIWSHKYSGSGNISEGLVFGRIAGANAAVAKSDVPQTSVMNGKPNFEPVQATPLYKLEAGEKLGIGRGMGGDIAIAVKVVDGKITSVRVLSQHETPSIGGKAIEVLPAEAVSTNGSINAVAGASVTSAGFKQALSDALAK